MIEILPYLPLLLEGLGLTVVITVLSIVLTTVIAFALGIARVSQNVVVRTCAAVLVEVFRGVSLLILMYWLFYVLPFLGIDLLPIAAGILALGLNGGAYAAEIVRSAILSRPKGQTEATVALGLSRTATLWRIILPQSIPAMLPSLGNVYVDVLKATSLVSLVTIADLTFRAQVIRAATGQTTAIFLLILVLYFLLSLLIGRLIKRLEHAFDLNRPLPKRRLVAPVNSPLVREGGVLR